MTKIILLSQDVVLREALGDLLHQFSGVMVLSDDKIASADVILVDSPPPLPSALLGADPSKIFYLNPAQGQSFAGASETQMEFQLRLPVNVKQLIGIIMRAGREKHLETVWQIGVAVFLPTQKTVSFGEATIHLTEIETHILLQLAEHPEGLTREDCLTKVLGYAVTTETHAVEAHLYRLRKKLCMVEAGELIIFDQPYYRLTKPARHI